MQGSLLRRWWKPAAVARHCLRFTGSCSRQEFTARCQEQKGWYHSFYFDNGFVQRGDYDIGRNIDDYGFPADLNGMTVLDVGTGSGWFAVYFEQCGAQVTTVDVRGLCDYDVFGRPGYGDLAGEKKKPDRLQPDGRPVYHSPVSGGFWIMKDLLGLEAEFVNARIYDLSPQLLGGRRFDLVFLGSVLMHLRDPVGALMAVRSVCRERVIATSLRLASMDRHPQPLMALIAPQTRDICGWWQPNRACVEQWFWGAGFTRVDAGRTVTLTLDQPARDRRGRSRSSNQLHYRIEAWV